MSRLALDQNSCRYYAGPLPVVLEVVFQRAYVVRPSADTRGRLVVESMAASLVAAAADAAAVVVASVGC